MRILIVESNRDLGEIWSGHLERAGCEVHLTCSEDAAISFIQTHDVAVIVLNLVIEQGSALAISDYASYRQPDAKVVFVTSTSFFSDGSIFKHAANAAAYIKSSTPPEDLTAMVTHYAGVR